MNLLREIEEYQPYNAQEARDKNVMLGFLKSQDNILTRENEIAHFTASAWVLNKGRSKVLMIYHNIYDSWAWTGGHADGEENLLTVAIREVKEETGIKKVWPIQREIFSLETLTVEGHMKNGKYVASHLHINCTYLLEACDEEALLIKPDENQGVRWMDIEECAKVSTEPSMQKIYQKLNDKLKHRRKENLKRDPGEEAICSEGM
jgi:8-oxo-dGTP pyrophosphatase MutT (NUDIX family)